MSTIYSGVSVGRSAIGRVDSSGIIYNAASGGSIIGQVDSSGTIYLGVSVGKTAVGQVDSSGIIYEGVSVGRSAIGRIDSDGIIYNSASGGNAIGQVDGDGEKLAGAGGAALLLLNLTPNSSSSFSTSDSSPSSPSNSSHSRSSSQSSSSSSGEKPGCLGLILGFFGLIFWKLPIGGKICALLGIALPIIGAITGHNGNFILIVPIGFLIGGGIGALGNLIIPKLSKAGKLGTLIGALALGIGFEIMLLTGHISKSFGNIAGFAIFGIIIGAVVGAIIGAIVGLIRKQITKKKQSQE